jgi:c-di-GMP-binding flagellar brake protein YcgR
MTNHDYKDVEHRKFTRIQYPLMVNYRIIGGGDKERISRTIEGQTKDVSLGGMCLQTNILEINGLHIYIDTNNIYQNLLALEIDLPFCDKKIKTVGKVAWYNLSTRRRKYQYDVGIIFLEMSNKDEKNLSRFLNKSSNTKKKI